MAWNVRTGARWATAFVILAASAGCESLAGPEPRVTPAPAHSAARVTAAAGLEHSADLAAAVAHLAVHVDGWYTPAKVEVQPRSPAVLSAEDAAAISSTLARLQSRVRASLAGHGSNSEVRVPFR